MPDNTAKRVVSIGFCKPTLRGIGRTNPELSWYAERMLSRHFDLKYSDTPDFLIYGDDGSGEHLLYPASTIRIFITGENILPDWSEADYALTHERLYTDRHWRVPLHRHWYDTTYTVPMRDFSVIRSRVMRFCNFIYSNDRAAERIEFFDRLSAYKRVDAGGKVRNNMSGRIDDKLEFISQCKFTIAFENESREGYATEKLIQPLLRGSIPIYWGDPTIELDFNPECMINVHRFATFDDAIAEVIRVDQDDALWEKYVTAPIFPNDVIPEKLSDEAIIAFFDRIFTGRRHHVSRQRRIQQRLAQTLRTSGAVKRLGEIRAGAARRARAAARKVGVAGE